MSTNYITPSQNRKWWEEALEQAPGRTSGGQAYFTDVPADIAVDGQGTAAPSRWTNMRRLHYDWLKETLAESPENSRVIDVGCGPGQFSDLLKNHDCCNIDFFPYANIDLVLDLGKNLPFVSECADLVVLSNVLEHIYEPRHLIDN